MSKSTSSSSSAQAQAAGTSQLPYRPCVGQMVFNRDGLVWIGCRAQSKQQAEGHGNWWQMPQGGIEANESPAVAVRRELIEETGMRSVDILAELPVWLNYDLPNELVGKAWGGRYRGQTQKWFALRFTGDDSEICITPPDGLEAEFIDWRWAAVDDLIDVIIPFKRQVYHDVIAGFRHFAVPMSG